MVASLVCITMFETPLRLRFNMYLQRFRPGRALPTPRVPKRTFKNLIALKRMGLDLETLKAEMQAYLDRESMTVFHGYSRTIDSPAQVYWDVENHPDFR